MQGWLKPAVQLEEVVVVVGGTVVVVVVGGEQLAVQVLPEAEAVATSEPQFPEAVLSVGPVAASAVRDQVMNPTEAAAKARAAIVRPLCMQPSCNVHATNTRMRILSRAD